MTLPTIPRASRMFAAEMARSILFLLCVCSLAIPAGAQSPGKLVLELDKTQPRQKPEASSTKGQQSKGVGKKQTSATQTTSQAAASTSDTSQATALSQACDLTVLLLRDDTRTAFVNVYNYPPNSAVTVTLTQTNAGVVEYSSTPTGTFIPTLDVVIQTDGNGNGQSADFYIQGAQVGGTTTYGQSQYGYTTSVDFTVLPQCNCPPIPIVQ